MEAEPEELSEVCHTLTTSS